ncbi:MAG TPA: hypothetical protein VG847_10205 [Chitinophagaceae bacterium]|nr:hypothetical protein [Chitinophagaceae bacterium]
MKKIIFICLLLQSSLAFSQAAPDNDIRIDSFNVHGYVNGIRLDSIHAEYAQCTSVALGNKEYFEYGRPGQRKLVSNGSGHALKFNNKANDAFVLNFFYFNGWEFAGYLGNGEIVLRKRKMN